MSVLRRRCLQLLLRSICRFQTSKLSDKSSLHSLPLSVAKTDSTSDDVTLLLLLEYMGIRKVVGTLGRMICGLLPRKLGID